ncbi:MAG: hypothetical protein ABI887_07740 [Burkholderiales bacterium]
MIHRLSLIAAIATALVGVSTAATAEDTTSTEHTLGQHPAILVKRQTPQIDTNRFILAHPAGLFVIATPSPTYDHPAVVVARMAREPSDLERYMAQPPVASAWLRHDTLSVAASATTSSH